MRNVALDGSAPLRGVLWLTWQDCTSRPSPLGLLGSGQVLKCELQRFVFLAGSILLALRVMSGFNMRLW